MVAPLKAPLLVRNHLNTHTRTLHSSWICIHQHAHVHPQCVIVRDTPWMWSDTSLSFLGDTQRWVEGLIHPHPLGQGSRLGSPAGLWSISHQKSRCVLIFSWNVRSTEEVCRSPLHRFVTISQKKIVVALSILLKMKPNEEIQKLHLWMKSLDLFIHDSFASQWKTCDEWEIRKYGFCLCRRFCSQNQFYRLDNSWDIDFEDEKDKRCIVKLHGSVIWNGWKDIGLSFWPARCAVKTNTADKKYRGMEITEPKTPKGKCQRKRWVDFRCEPACKRKQNEMHAAEDCEMIYGRFSV